MTLQPGMTIGRYQILSQLGQGGMATVYKAFQPSLDRTVALKIMRAGLSEDAEFKERFAREAKAIARLEHPNIVQVYDYDEIDGRAFMAMAFIEGGTLKDKLDELEKNGERLPPRESARIINQVADGLAYAHGLGIVHRDVKSSNVMLTRDGRAVVSDFGIAKILSGTQYTQAGVGIGTPEYMSPEQGQGKTVDQRSDLYSLAVMAYEMLVGKLPFTAETPLAVVLMHVRDPLPPPSQINPAIGEATEQVLLKGLAKDPAERYQKVTDFSAALQRAISEDAGGTQRTVMVGGAGAAAAGATMKTTVPAAPAAGRSIPGGPVGIGAIAVVGFLVLFTILGAAGVCPPVGPWPQPPTCAGAVARPAPSATAAVQATGAATIAPAPSAPSAATGGGPAKGALIAQLDAANPTSGGFTVNRNNQQSDRVSAAGGALQIEISANSNVGIALTSAPSDVVIEATVRLVSGQGGYQLSARTGQSTFVAAAVDPQGGALSIVRLTGSPPPRVLAGPKPGAVAAGAGRDQIVGFSAIARDLVAYGGGVEALRAQDSAPASGVAVLGLNASPSGAATFQVVSLKIYKAP